MNTQNNWVELIATLFACWMELNANKKIVSNEALFSLLYNWSKEKQKYSQPEVLKAIHWMKENNVVPC
jgi:type I restriction enzyme S subunit